MPLLVGLALLALAQDRTDTRGKSDAQILAMGRTRWHDFFVGELGGSTAGEAGAESLYGEALARRNDRLLKGAKSPLRKHLTDFSNDVQGVGYAITGGGTMWNVAAASLYADEEEALYRVLTHSGRGPRRVVSDVEKTFAPLRRGLARIDSSADFAKMRAEGRAAMARLPADLRAVVRDAKGLPRRDSDTLLEFCRRTVVGVKRQATLDE